MEHVRVVLSKLSEAKLTAKPSKCEWGKQYVQYLGHTVGEGRVSVPEARVESIKHYVRPKTKEQLKSFPGTIGNLSGTTQMLPSPSTQPPTSPAPHSWSGQRRDWHHFVS